ncbi:MAG: response regulator [Defluviicoccus sp.]
MTLSDQISSRLPYLRRYARALTGSQSGGDALVATTLEALVADPDRLPDALEPRAALYRLFHQISATAIVGSTAGAGDDGSPAERVTQKRLSALASLPRQALLLTVLEEFTAEDAAAILQIDVDHVRSLVANALSDIERQMAISVLIIEDEPMIALDLEEIVRSLGHSVVDLVDTRDKAIRASVQTRPGLVLADIQLADGSSGIDAVKDILGKFEVPVIFITSFPERLLTGDKPEPTFLITKPFKPATVKAAISQALFFERTARLPA